MDVALQEAADDLPRLAYVVPGTAGKEEYERTLTVRRASTEKWLRARADMIDALADSEGDALIKAIYDRTAD